MNFWKRFGWLWFILPAILMLLPGCSESSPTGQGSGPVLVEPGVAVGKVRAGMTSDQVIAALGEPKRRTSTALTYPEDGLAVMCDKLGRVVAVLCGDVMGPGGPFVAAFHGRSSEGIGMNSTADEIIAAYGPPAVREVTGPRIESIRYPERGLSFTLERGRVYHMIVQLPGEPFPTGNQAPGGISVDLVPPAPGK